MKTIPYSVVGKFWEGFINLITVKIKNNPNINFLNSINIQIKSSNQWAHNQFKLSIIEYKLDKIYPLLQKNEKDKRK